MALTTSICDWCTGEARLPHGSARVLKEQQISSRHLARSPLTLDNTTVQLWISGLQRHNAHCDEGSLRKCEAIQDLYFLPGHSLKTGTDSLAQTARHAPGIISRTSNAYRQSDHKFKPGTGDSATLFNEAIAVLAEQPGENIATQPATQPGHTSSFPTLAGTVGASIYILSLMCHGRNEERRSYPMPCS